MAELTLSELRTMRDDLIRVRMSGVTQMGRNGSQVMYSGDKDMARKIADMDRRIAELEGTTPVNVTGGAVDMFS